MRRHVHGFPLGMGVIVLISLIGPGIRVGANPITNQAILKAAESVERARARAEADPQRPAFHFRPAVLMRKNSFHHMSDDGATTEAILMTLYRTLKLRGHDGLSGDTLEIRVSFGPEPTAAFGVRLRRSEDGARGVNIGWSGSDLDIAGFRVPLEDRRGADPLSLVIYLDKSVLEVFVNGGETAVTRVLSVPETDLGVELFTEGGSVAVESFEAHRLNPIW